VINQTVIVHFPRFSLNYKIAEGIQAGTGKYQLPMLRNKLEDGLSSGYNLSDWPVGVVVVDEERALAAFVDICRCSGLCPIGWLPRQEKISFFLGCCLGFGGLPPC